MLSTGIKIIDFGWPWTTLNGENALCCRKDASFGAHCTNLNEDRPILSATKMYANDSSFWKYKVHAHIRGSSSWRGPQMRVGLWTTAIFGHLNGYFFGNFRCMASNIIWWYATPCQPVIDCKMNDLEWPLSSSSCSMPLQERRRFHDITPLITVISSVLGRPQPQVLMFEVILDGA